MGKLEDFDTGHDGRDWLCPGSDRRASWAVRLDVSLHRFPRQALVAGLIGMGVLASGPAGAQAVGDAAAGQSLALRWCSSCHMVDVGQPNALATGVPTFAGVARMPSTTALSLRVFLQTPHVRMPDFNLTQGEIGDVAAYILSLKGR